MHKLYFDLIIWDLDDTFWKGTLSEGPISIVEKNCQYVKELAQRNIKNSICSKNDFEASKIMLNKCKIWHYFESPSINWDAKGLRIKHIIESLNIHPSKVLFIDDKDSNLIEAKNLIPDIHILNAKYKNQVLDTIINNTPL